MLKHAVACLQHPHPHPITPTPSMKCWPRVVWTYPARAHTEHRIYQNERMIFHYHENNAEAFVLFYNAVGRCMKH